MPSPITRSFRTISRSSLEFSFIVLILAIGTIINCIGFSIAYPSLIKPLSLPEASELRAFEGLLNGEQGNVSWQELRDAADEHDLIRGAAGYRARSFGLTDSSADPTSVVLAGMVTPAYFRTLRIRPVLGKDFESTNDAFADEHVIILTASIWRVRYHSNPSIIGKSLFLNGTPYRVVGILPTFFHFGLDGQDADIFIPLSREDYCCSRDNRAVLGIVRLGSGITTARASLKLKTISSRLSHEFPDTNAKQRFVFAPLQDAIYGSEIARTTIMLWISLTAITVAAILNAGSLLLAASLRDLPSVAIKVSLGATSWRLIRERLNATILLAGCVIVCSSLGTIISLRLLTLVPAELLRVPPLTHGDILVTVLFCLTLSLLTTLAASLFPVGTLRFLPLAQMSRFTVAKTSSRKMKLTREALISCQVGVGVFLLLAAFLVSRSLENVLGSDPGFNSSHVTVSALGIPNGTYDSDSKQISFHENALRELSDTFGLNESCLSAGFPLNSFRTRLLFPGMSLPEKQRPTARIAFVSPNCFKTLQIPMLAGRAFTAQDSQGRQLVAITNRAFAQTFLGGALSAGNTVGVGFTNSIITAPYSRFTIVGTVADFKNRTIVEPPEPEIFLSTGQIPLDAGLYLVKSSLPMTDLKQLIPASIWRVDRNLQKVSVESLASFNSEILGHYRIAEVAFSAFSIIAMFLVFAGLFANLLRYVQQDTHNIGVRSALGETRASIAGRVIRNAVLTTARGFAAGLILSLLLWKIITAQIVSRLYISDSLSVLCSTGLIFLTIAILSSAIPAYRASRVSPLEALRSD